MDVFDDYSAVPINASFLCSRLRLSSAPCLFELVKALIDSPESVKIDCFFFEGLLKIFEKIFIGAPARYCSKHDHCGQDGKTDDKCLREALAALLRSLGLSCF